MRGRDKHDDELEEFIAARTQDLHHDAYQLTAAQQAAEELVIGVLADMRRDRIDLAQAGSTARLRMARISARDNTPSDSGVSQLAAEFQPLARLSPRQRAVLVLRVIERYDERETARALQLTSRAASQALNSVPYDELPGTTPQSTELGSLLEDFGDLATTPSASTTLVEVRAVPPPPRRPWWTYVAAFLVITLTIATVVVTQRWHEDWLKTPEGLNRAHGTRFSAYFEGYKLVDIREIKPGPTEEFSAGADGAVTMNCDELGPRVGMTVSSALTGGTYFRRAGCAANDTRPALIPAVGATTVSINDFSRDTWPVAVYRKIPLSEYPIATSDFDVQHDLSLDDVRTMQSTNGTDTAPQSKGTVLTLHGTSAHPNGTFRASLQLPPATVGTDLQVVGLVSPTTTGRYRVRLDHRAPWTTCGDQRPLAYDRHDLDSACVLVDHRVPQVEFDLVGAARPEARMPVEITVEDARGPWTLQVVADRYDFDTGSSN